MNILNRHLAPIDQGIWSVIDMEAKRVLTQKLALRKVVDFSGPHGLDLAAINTGRRENLAKTPEEGVILSLRKTLPVVELKTTFSLPLNEIESLARGAGDFDLTPIANAAAKMARGENSILLNGLEPAGIRGIAEASPYEKINIAKEGEALAGSVANGVKNLLQNSIEGPYALLVGFELFGTLFRDKEGGYPIHKKLETILGSSKILPVGNLGNNALVVSLRGGDYEMVSGQDVSVGFSRQNGEELEFFLFETFSFRLNTPEATISLGV